MINNNLTVQNINGALVVSSRQVAEDFGKAHSSVVVRAIENLKESLETSVQNCTHLFIEATYQDSYGREQKEYLLTRDGFSLVVMGFTGAKALQWKLKYIEAFNKMKEALMEQKPKLPTNFKEALLCLVQAEEEKEALLLENAQVKQIAEENLEKAQAFDNIFEKTEGFDVETVAKAFGIKGLGRNNLFRYLKDIEWLDKKNKPKQITIDRGYVVAIPYTFKRGDSNINAIKTLLTEKGIRALYRRLSEIHLIKKSRTVEDILMDLNKV